MEAEALRTARMHTSFEELNFQTAGICAVVERMWSPERFVFCKIGNIMSMFEY